MCLRYILKCFGRDRKNYVRFEKEKEQEQEIKMGIQTDTVFAPHTLQHHTNDNEHVKIMWNDCPLYEDS